MDIQQNKPEQRTFTCPVCERCNTGVMKIEYSGLVISGEYLQCNCRDCGHTWKENTSENIRTFGLERMMS